ncbi:hypothetical protein I9Y31_003016 [Clostridium perfringens]|nr:hypothetical protein [Clostridium perfringens]
MNKRIRAIIEFVKVHKKESIGLGVALGVAVIGVGGYAINKHYANKTAETNNIALAEKKEDSSLDLENNEDDPKEEAKETENDIVVEESEDGTLIVKDKDNPVPPAQNNKPVEQPSVDNNKPQQPVEKPVETPKPQPPVEKPTEKPQESVKPEKPKRTWEYQGAMSQELWSLFNQYRQENGLNPLNWSGKYASWTKQHAEEMAQKESTFHKSYPEGGQVVTGGNAYTTASGFLQAFKNSPQHNKNLLDDELTEGACAIYKDSNGQFYVVIGFDY